MLKQFLAILGLLLLTIVLAGQTPLATYKPMFIQQHKMLGVAQLDIDYAQLEYEKSKKAQYPSLALNAQYSLRNGGREY
ncbi:MAG: hypothetical protein AAGD05_13610 [Bacteroidota bacterium]